MRSNSNQPLTSSLTVIEGFVSEAQIELMNRKAQEHQERMQKRSLRRVEKLNAERKFGERAITLEGDVLYSVLHFAILYCTVLVSRKIFGIYSSSRF